MIRPRPCWLVLAMIGALALAHATLAQTPGGAAPICAQPGTRSGAPERVRPWDDSSAYSTAPGQIAGEVVTIDGQPIGWARIILRQSRRDTATVAFALTDSAGRFVLGQLPPRDYELEIFAIGFLRQVHEFQLLGAAADTVCVRLRAKPISVPPVWPNAIHR